MNNADFSKRLHPVLYQKPGSLQVITKHFHTQPVIPTQRVKRTTPETRRCLSTPKICPEPEIQTLSIL